jgi:3-deoxy-D-manno-octulosonate 8-phosphate phosphatase (KDO 8-P phosphatase)
LYSWGSLGSDQINNSNEPVDAIARHFADLGGVFVVAATDLAAKIKNIQALIFDWDGVFNDGTKDAQRPSTFNEADSMGTNMLRYGLWRRSGRLPVSAVISGEKNAAAEYFAKREHFDAIYAGIADKRRAVAHLCAAHNISPEAIACVFDDINDLSMAKLCGVRCLVRRPASPLFTRYTRDNQLCDYITGSESGHQTVREFSELFLGLSGVFEKVIASRLAFDQPYREYFRRRQAVSTLFYKQEGDAILEAGETPHKR